MIRLHYLSPDGSQGSAERTSLDDPRVAAAVEEYLTALEAGRAPARAPFLARYPREVAAAVAQCLDGLELVRSAEAGLQPARPLEPPPTLGDFRLIREVGRGGMGVVYEAEQISLRRRVALKVLSLAGGLDVRQLQRFRTEAQAAAGLHHTHIAPVYAVGCERGVHYYAMQFIDGPSLAEVIAARRQQAGLTPTETGPRGQAAPAGAAAPTRPVAAAVTDRTPGGGEPWRGAARLAIEAADALDYAHQQGIVHRDVKPANLLLDAEANLWVVDFGLARLQSDAGLTMTGDMVGTLRYMSPEQALGGRAVIDHRADVYGLGVTLYELLVLAPAFPGDNRHDLLRRVAEEDPPPPRRLAPGIPPDLEVIVLKAMAKEPAERYATARELADDLHRLLEDRPIVARRPSLPQRARRWARRHRSLALSLGAAAALVVVGLVLGLLTYAHYQGILRRKSQEAQQDAEAKKREAQSQLYDALLESARGVRLARRPGYRAVVWDKLRRAHELPLLCKDQSAFADEVLACLGDPVGLDPVEAPGAERLARPRLPAGFAEYVDNTYARANPGAKITCAATPGGDRAAAAVAGTVNLFGPAGLIIVPVPGKPGEMQPQLVTPPTWASRRSSHADSPLGQVYDLEFSRDGSYLAAGCEGGLAVWRLHSEIVHDALRYMLFLQSAIPCGNVCYLALHPERRLVATIGREIRLWSFPDGRPIVSLPLPPEVDRVRFSADGQLLLALAGDRAVVGWTVGDTAEKRRLRFDDSSSPPRTGQAAGVPGVAFSPDGRQLVAVSKDKTVRAWDPETGRRLYSTWGHNAEIEGLAFSPDGRLLATGDFDGGVFVWDGATGKELARLTDPHYRPCERGQPPGQIWRLQFDAAGEQLAAGGAQGVAVWSVRRGERGLDVRQRAALAAADVYDMAFHPGGASLAFVTQSKDGGALYRYDLGAEGARPMGVTVRRQVRVLNFDASGRFLTFVTPRRTFARRDWDSGSGVPAPDLPAFQWAAAPGGRWVATTGPDNGVVLYDFDAGTRTWALPPEESDVWSLAWAPDGQRLALGLSDGSVAVWDLGQVRERLAEFGIPAPSARPPS